MKNWMKTLLPLALVAVMLGAAPAAVAGDCCQPCCKVVCCPPPPVPVTLEVVDPCTCCKYEVTACVPACCKDETPCCEVRNGLFGRKVFTYTWPCCGHQVKVILTKHGRTIVR